MADQQSTRSLKQLLQLRSEAETGIDAKIRPFLRALGHDVWNEYDTCRLEGEYVDITFANKTTERYPLSLIDDPTPAAIAVYEAKREQFEKLRKELGL